MLWREAGGGSQGSGRSVATGKRSVEERQPQGEVLEGMIKCSPRTHTLTLLSQWYTLCRPLWQPAPLALPSSHLGFLLGHCPHVPPHRPWGQQSLPQLSVPCACFRIPSKWVHLYTTSPTHVFSHFLFFFFPINVTFGSVTQACQTLCDPMNCSTPGLPVHHQLPEFTQTHVHRVSDAIQPSHIVVSRIILSNNMFCLRSNLLGLAFWECYFSKRIHTK